MKLDTNIVQSVEPGRHTGTIMEVNARDSKGYKYVDFKVLIVEGENSFELNLSAPEKISVSPDGTPKSGLAEILSRLGIKLEGSVDVDSAVTKKIDFVTTEKTTDKGTFAEIDVKSIKLSE